MHLKNMFLLRMTCYQSGVGYAHAEGGGEDAEGSGEDGEGGGSERER